MNIQYPYNTYTVPYNHLPPAACCTAVWVDLASRPAGGYCILLHYFPERREEAGPPWEVQNRKKSWFWLLWPEDLDRFLWVIYRHAREFYYTRSRSFIDSLVIICPNILSYIVSLLLRYTFPKVNLERINHTLLVFDSCL